MKKVLILIISLMLISSFIFADELYPPMDNGKLDKDGFPFDYFLRPTTVIGVKDGKYGTMITPEGYLYTGWAELQFFVGENKTPVNQRVKELYKGYLPIVETKFSHDGINYKIQSFTANLDKDLKSNTLNPVLKDEPSSNGVNFVKVTISNPKEEIKNAYFFAGICFMGETPRFTRAEAERFSLNWSYSMTENLGLRNKKIIFLYPNPTKRYIREGLEYTELGKEIKFKDIDPSTPLKIVKYKYILNPKERVNLIFKMPTIPYEISNANILLDANYDYYFKKQLRSGINF